MAVQVINDELHFQAELAGAGIKLVVVDFTATWCGPCQRIAPFFEQMPTKYPRAVFLKVDVDKCAETAAAQGVSAMPTFIFYRNRTKVDRLQGADIQAVENKIRQHIGSTVGEEGVDDGGDAEEYGQGLMDLSSFIMKNDSECLNQDDEHPYTLALSGGPGFLQSDCDEQLVLSITFTQAVKIHSLKFKSPPKLGPKNIKLFINQPRTLDFDQADSFVSVQDLELSPKDVDGNNTVNLRYVKFQNVQNIQLFIKDNQGGGDKTQLDRLVFIGAPITQTKMEDFKRISGKRGESH